MTHPWFFLPVERLDVVLRKLWLNGRLIGVNYIEGCVIIYCFDSRSLSKGDLFVLESP